MSEFMCCDGTGIDALRRHAAAFPAIPVWLRWIVRHSECQQAVTAALSLEAHARTREDVAVAAGRQGLPEDEAERAPACVTG